MLQALIAYALVAVAAGWTLWSLVLKGWLKRRAKAGKSSADCGPDCACGD